MIKIIPRYSNVSTTVWAHHLDSNETRMQVISNQSWKQHSTHLKGGMNPSNALNTHLTIHQFKMSKMLGTTEEEAKTNS